MHLKTPREINEPIMRFCQSIEGAQVPPIYVPVQPMHGEPFDECFPTVQRKIERDGGTMVCGWMIWEMAYTLVEADHHGVWVSPDGKMIDVTPKRDGEKQILFLVDPSKPWVFGERLPKPKMALRDHPVIHEFIRLSLRRESMMPKPGEIKMPSDYPAEFVAIDRRCGELGPHILRMYNARMASRKKRK